MRFVTAALEKVEDPSRIARAVGLEYVLDHLHGIRRKRLGKTFIYIGPRGRRVTAQPTLDRIRALAIPPAWTKVWICASAKGHIQAVGRDARGRKQYRYHSSWSEERNHFKFQRLIEFGQALEKARKALRRDLRRRGLERRKVLAAMVRLLECSLIRIGNEEYTRTNHSYGLTTLRADHVRLARGSTIHFHFRGKAGVERSVMTSDRALARVVRACKKLGGKVLFKWVDEQGGVHKITSSDVNQYLREITGTHFTAKTFRTWGGTLFATQQLGAMPRPSHEKDGKKKTTEAVRRVAERLGNTPAICRGYYIHPAVLREYLDGGLPRSLMRARARGDHSESELSGDERALLALLKRREAERRPAAVQRLAS